MLLVRVICLLAVPFILGTATDRLSYPVPPRSDATIDKWGVRIPDPYRPLERLDAPETTAWVAAETAVTNKYLNDKPTRAAIRRTFQAMFPAGKHMTATAHHGTVESETVTDTVRRPMIVARPSHGAPQHVVLDENTLPADEVVTYTAWSRDGRYLAYGTQQAGYDWVTWHIVDASSGVALPDVVRWSKYFTASFDADRGLFYSGYDEPTSAQRDGAPLGAYKAFYHRIGTKQTDDVVVDAGSGDGQTFPATYVTSDGKYDVVLTGRLSQRGWDAFSAGDLSGPRRHVILPSEGQSTWVGSDGSTLYFVLYNGSPHGRIVAVDIADSVRTIRDVVPESTDTIDAAAVVGGRLFLSYLHDAHADVRVMRLSSGTLSSITLPGIGTVVIHPMNESDDALYLDYESLIEPTTTYRFDAARSRLEEVDRLDVPFAANDYTTDEIFATSRDGTRVPVFVAHAKDVRYDGATPTILWGRGSDGYDIKPQFGQQPALWLRMGGAYAIVCARGGAEYGEAWHLAALKANRFRAFEDVEAAARLLILTRLTSAKKLALYGSSGGGLMAAAVEMRQPSLFGAIIANAGPYDMLRFQDFTGGASWAGESGTSDESVDMFHALLAYSPLQNVRLGTAYPATLILAGDHDDRVVPSHAYKFAAALQAAQAGDAPILLRVQNNGGHDFNPPGAGADALADRYAFLTRELQFTPTL